MAVGFNVVSITMNALIKCVLSCEEVAVAIIKGCCILHADHDLQLKSVCSFGIGLTNERLIVTQERFLHDHHSPL